MQRTSTMMNRKSAYPPAPTALLNIFMTKPRQSGIRGENCNSRSDSSLVLFNCPGEEKKSYQFAIRRGGFLVLSMPKTQFANNKMQRFLVYLRLLSLVYSRELFAVTVR